jgi:tetratricopeptide (TPR) repeat protein
LGNALKHQGKAEEAIAAHRKAIELDPQYAPAHNNLAWLLATSSDAKFRDPAQAITLAEKAVEIAPQDPTCPNTLGVAYYRIGNWKASITALEKSIELRKGGDSCDWFFLAMAHWQLGNKDTAREWYEKAVEWAEKNAAANDELRRFRAEVAQLLGVKDDKKPGPSDSNATAESEANEE